jgi:hypothetical protein
VEVDGDLLAGVVEVAEILPQHGVVGEGAVVGLPRRRCAFVPIIVCDLLK